MVQFLQCTQNTLVRWRICLYENVEVAEEVPKLTDVFFCGNYVNFLIGTPNSQKFRLLSKKRHLRADVLKYSDLGPIPHI